MIAPCPQASGDVLPWVYSPVHDRAQCAAISPSDAAATIGIRRRVVKLTDRLSTFTVLRCLGHRMLCRCGGNQTKNFFSQLLQKSDCTFSYGVVNRRTKFQIRGLSCKIRGDIRFVNNFVSTINYETKPISQVPSVSAKHIRQLIPQGIPEMSRMAPDTLSGV